MALRSFPVVAVESAPKRKPATRVRTTAKKAAKKAMSPAVTSFKIPTTQKKEPAKKIAIKDARIIHAPVPDTKKTSSKIAKKAAVSIVKTKASKKGTPEKISPVDPIVLLLKVWVSFSKTKVSDALSAGIVAVLETPGVREEIVVVLPVPKTI